MKVINDKMIDGIARVCHEANRAHCFNVGDFSQKPYDEADEWQKESAREGVRFALNNPNITARDQHKAWADKKRADGWVFGAEKDATKKTHPALVDFDKLPVEQRVKDGIFLGIVRAFEAAFDDVTG